jgi:hypothetical protein
LSLADNLRRHAHRLLSIAALVVLALGVALVWARVVHTLVVADSSGPAIGRPQGIVWGTHVFTSEAQLRAYLVAHGLSYERWIARHPAAAAIVGRKPVVPKNQQQPGKAAKPATLASSGPSVPVRTAAGAGLARDSGSGFSWSTIALDLLIAIGVMIGVSALIPITIAPGPVARFYAIPERRVLASAAAVAILCGLGLSRLLS